ncbi:CRISPR/Cas system CMR subunit Cmr4 (Cas7 group RAMP superfamily) [Lysinibacillus composti]|uniref:Uncharacterized protein n=1 Tax=Lysinibacillus composti TaxID=720633 RepID=A0A3N9UGY7_9BACI|nr:hypothetical protein [Lysinibacillus composti]MBM7607961.1 CRISPR/Cas system CMR subunit Cmr4 (Cas7 group RAMP superfamily) [Lysinibacillus composti]RQW75423.1 hypothetical protein EBB45_06665 [Lysinibacillus composti]
MEKEEKERKQFLVQQLEWFKKQDLILEEIEFKLLEMKRIAQYVANDNLTSLENEQLNAQFNKLKSEVHLLEKQLHSIVH